MSGGLGRNEPCWCGSGLKYKRCHLGREDDEAISPWQAAQAHRDAFSVKECLAARIHPGECDGRIVGAHTVPRSGSLAKIARDGHVYTFMPGMDAIIKNDGELVPQLTGIGKASVFYGFCQKHDRELFLPLEVEEFAARPDQCLLLAYRAYAKEAYNKRASLETVAVMKKADKGRSKAEQLAIQMMVSGFETGTRAAIADLEHKHDAFDKALSEADYSCVRAFVVKLAGPPPVMASGGFNPEFDFDGNALQSLADLGTVPAFITVTSFCSGDEGYFVLSWLEQDDAVCAAFVKTLDGMSDAEMTDGMLGVLFEYCENIQVAPDWWESLDGTQRKGLVAKMRKSADTAEERGSDCMALGVTGIQPWDVASRAWVGSNESGV